MRVSTDLLPSVPAVTTSLLPIARNKTLCNVSSTYYAPHIDLVIVVYRVFDWGISSAILNFILRYFVLVGS